MKKSFYFVLALTAGLFASCSSDDIAEAPSLAIDDNAPAEIVLGVKGDVTVTRGTGTVGVYPADGTTGYGWSEQKFNVYMLDKGKLTRAVQQYGTAYDATDNPYVYDDEEFIAPKQEGNVDPNSAGYTQSAALKSGLTAYYPSDGKYDFWAYRVDDAQKEITATNKWVKKDATAANGITDLAATETEADADYLVAPFKIDGSQDLMVAEVSPSKALSSDVTEADLYSAKTARRSINPNFSFKHLLTRLTFKVIADNVEVSEAAPDLAGKGDHGSDYFNGFKVTAISVHSANTGNLIVAYKKDATTPANDPTLEQRIIWDAAPAKWTPDATTGVVDLPELFLQSRTKNITGAAIGSFLDVNTATLAGLTLDGTTQIGSTGKYFKETTRIYANGTEVPTVADNCDATSGRPTLVYKTAKEWVTMYSANPTSVPATLWYWNEQSGPTYGTDYSASADLDELEPVIPKWDATAGTTYSWTAYTGAYYEWTVNTTHVDDGNEVNLTSAPADGITAPAGIVPDATKVYEYNDGTNTTYYNVTTTLAAATIADDGADPTTATVGGVGDVRRNGTNYFSCTAVNAGGAAVATPVGEALLVAPANEQGYLVTVYFSHYKPSAAGKCALDEKGKISKQIRLSSATSATPSYIPFKRAKQYNITIKLFKDGTGAVDTTVEDFTDDAGGKFVDENGDEITEFNFE